MSKSEKRKKDLWNGLGSAFWQTLSFLSIAMLLLGAATLAFSLLRLLYGDRWVLWYVLAAAGLGTIVLSLLCLDIFPSWGSLIRRMRLSEARMEGAMSISEINKYEEREDRRTSDIKESMAESVNRVGRDVMETKDQIGKNAETMNAMEQKLEAVIRTMEKMDIKNPPQDRFDKIEETIKTLSRQIDRHTDSVNSSIRDMQRQVAIQEKLKEAIAERDSDKSNEEQPQKETTQPPVPEKKEDIKKTPPAETAVGEEEEDWDDIFEPEDISDMDSSDDIEDGEDPVDADNDEDYLF